MCVIMTSHDGPAPEQYTGEESEWRWTRRAALRSLGLGVGTVGGLGLSTRGVESAAPAAVTPSDPGEEWKQQAKLVADDGDRGDFFGGAAAVDGDTAVVGAYEDEDPNGTASGSAYVFEREGDGWTQQAKLTADDGGVEDGFGYSVAVDGDTAIVGAHDETNQNGFEAGSAYVFEREGGDWTRRTELLAEDGFAEDGFGYSVAVDGDIAVVTALNDDNTNGVRAGAVYVFERQGEGWTQQARLVADDGDRADRLGYSAAIDGDTVVVGTPFDAGPDTTNVGSTYVFGRDGGEWTQRVKLTAADGDDEDRFGESVGVSGDTVVVGAVNNEDPNGGSDDQRSGAGCAYVFTRDESEWTQQTKLGAADGDEGDQFGQSLAVDGDTAVVGASADEEPNGDEAGSAYVFGRADGEWTQRTKIAAADGERNDTFGGFKTIDVDGDTAVVGAVSDENSNGLNAGAAYVFTLDSSPSLAERFDRTDAGTQGVIERTEVIDVIEAFNAGDPDIETGDVISVINAYNGDGQWDSVDA